MQLEFEPTSPVVTETISNYDLLKRLAEITAQNGTVETVEVLKVNRGYRLRWRRDEGNATLPP